jgi:hypothetical protein
MVTTAVRTRRRDITGTTVQAGTIVHDEATVAKAAGTRRRSRTRRERSTSRCSVEARATVRSQRRPGQAAQRERHRDIGDLHDTLGEREPSYLAHYNGDANYPAHNGPCAVQRDAPQADHADPGRLLAVRHETPRRLRMSSTRRRRPDRQSINPGVFFYWTNITTTVPNQVVTVTQTNNSTNNTALFTVHQG